MHLIRSTIMAWLNLGGWLSMTILLYARQREIFRSEDMAWVVLGSLMIWLVCCAVGAFRLTGRCVQLVRTRTDARLVARLLRDLKSEDLVKRQFALQTLADYSGQPLGLLYEHWGRWQFKVIRKLVKERQVVEVLEPLRKAPAPEAAPIIKADERGPVLEPLRRAFDETMERLADAIEGTLLDWTPDANDLPEPAEELLPPMPVEPYVEALRGPIEVIFRSLTETINAAPHARAVLASRERCQDLLGTFLDGALELAIGMRIEAAMVALPETAGASCGTGQWQPADRVLRGPSRSWVEKYRRMKAGDRDLF